MGWTAWLILGVTLLSLYFLFLVLYRLFLNAKGLQSQIAKTQELVAEAKAFKELEIEPAIAHNMDDIAKVLGERRAIGRKREKRAEARQRRLVQRIRDIEIDKR